MSTDLLRNRTMRLTRIKAAAALGLLSGLLSWLSTEYAPDVLTLSGLGLTKDGVTLLPGLIFGVILAGSVALYDGARPAPLALSLLFVCVGWAAAYHGAVAAHSAVDPLLPESLEKASREALTFFLALAAGNVIGGLPTIAAFGIAAGRRLPAMAWIMPLVAGLLTVGYVTYGIGLDIQGRTMLVLFLLWQTAYLVTLHAAAVRADELASRARA